MEFLKTNNEETFDGMKLEGVNEERYKEHLHKELEELFSVNEAYKGKDQLKKEFAQMIEATPEYVEAMFKLLKEKNSFYEHPYDEVIPEVNIYEDEDEEGEPMSDSGNSEADENHGSRSSQ